MNKNTEFEKLIELEKERITKEVLPVLIKRKQAKQNNEEQISPELKNLFG